MSTPRRHALVPLAVALTLTLAACATATPRPASDHQLAPAAAAPSLTMRFDNTAGDFVHVYLVGARRQWLLGRVEAGQSATLRLPREVLADDEGWVRVAVLVGQRASMRAADDPRAAMTSALPAAGMLSRRWSFSSKVGTGQITEISLRRVRPEGARP